MEGINWQCKHVIIAKIKAKSVSNGVMEPFLLWRHSWKSPNKYYVKGQVWLIKLAVTHFVHLSFIKKNKRHKDKYPRMTETSFQPYLLISPQG